jgi:glycosyltransferase A (GT-A) superfamily protein (DUF2064 family)
MVEGHAKEGTVTEKTHLPPLERKRFELSADLAHIKAGTKKKLLSLPITDLDKRVRNACADSAQHQNPKVVGRKKQSPE